MATHMSNSGPISGLTGTAALFLYLVYYEALGVPLWLIGIALGANCFCCGAISPLALELAAEITFPASEETAAAYGNNNPPPPPPPRQTSVWTSIHAFLTHFSRICLLCHPLTCALLYRCSARAYRVRWVLAGACNPHAVLDLSPPCMLGTHACLVPQVHEPTVQPLQPWADGGSKCRDRRQPLLGLGVGVVPPWQQQGEPQLLSHRHGLRLQ